MLLVSWNARKMRVACTQQNLVVDEDTPIKSLANCNSRHIDGRTTRYMSTTRIEHRSATRTDERETGDIGMIPYERRGTSVTRTSRSNRSQLSVALVGLQLKHSDREGRIDIRVRVSDDGRPIHNRARRSLKLLELRSRGVRHESLLLLAQYPIEATYCRHFDMDDDLLPDSILAYVLAEPQHETRRPD